MEYWLTIGEIEMVSSISASSWSFAENVRRSEKTGTPEDQIASLFRESFENKAEREKEKPEEKTGLNDAQRYMMNNVKTLAMASTMLENQEEDTKEEKSGWGDKEEDKKTKQGNDIAKISFTRTDSDSSNQGGGGSESEIVVMPDGSKVLILKTEISNGTQTSVKIPLGGGKDQLPHKGDDDAKAGVAQTPEAPPATL